MDYFYDREALYRFMSFLFLALLLALAILTLYAFWKWCTENDNQKKPKSSERLVMKPVYAHEIEPGIIILQDEDGDYFKILKEFDTKSGNVYGSVSPARRDTLRNDVTCHAVASTSGVSPSAPFVGRSSGTGQYGTMTTLFNTEQAPPAYYENK